MRRVRERGQKDIAEGEGNVEGKTRREKERKRKKKKKPVVKGGGSEVRKKVSWQ